MIELGDKRLAEKFGTPLFVYGEDGITENYRRLMKAFSYRPTRIIYAAMANYNPFILDTMRDMGLGVQIGSELELGLMLSSGFEKDKISYTSCGTSKELLERLCKQSIRVNFESLSEIEDYGKAARRLRKNSTLNGIRIYTGDFKAPKGSTNPSADSNVGIHRNEITDAKRIAKHFNLALGGVHGYAASNVSDVEYFKNFADYLTDIAEAFELSEYLNFGGGFSPDIDIKEIGNYYEEKVLGLSNKIKDDITLEIEPGRFLVANAGVLLTTVTRVKPVRNGKKQICVDAGMGEFARPFIYGTEDGGYHEIEPVAANSKIRIKCDIRAATVLQNDLLGRDRVMPDLKPGDVLAIKNAGAYAMSSGFPKPDSVPRSVFVTKKGGLCTNFRFRRAR